MLDAVISIASPAAVAAAAILIHKAGGFTRRQTRWVAAAVLASALIGGTIGFLTSTTNHPAAGSCWGCDTPTPGPVGR